MPSKPTISEVVGGYLFKYEKENLMLKVSRLRVHSSDGRVTGELLVSLLNNEAPIYPHTSFNFSSDRTRTTLVKTLVQVDKRKPWDEIINQVCLAVVNRAREGEPIRELFTGAPVARPQWLVEPILYKGLPTIIFGEKAVAKSTLALVIYLCLILPWSDNPLGWGVPDKSVKTLLADYEVDYEVTHYNAKRLQEGMGLAAVDVYYRRCAIPLADDIEQLQRHIANIGAEVLIVDSLGPAVGGDLKDPGQALRFTSALRQLKCASLIIGQTSKDREAKTKSTFGSVFFEYYARNILELRKVQEEGEDDMDIALFNTFNNLGRRHPPMGYHLHFNENTITIEKEEITAPELIKRIGTQARMKGLLLERGVMPVKDIAEELEITETNTRAVLSTLKKKGIVVKLETGYAMAAKEEY